MGKSWKKAYVWGILSAIFFGILTWVVWAKKTAGFDMAVIDVVQGWESESMTRVMKVFSMFGSTKVVIPLSISVLLFLGIVLKHRWELVLFIAVVGMNPLINYGLKDVFQRERPDFHRLIQEAGYSYPSGHSTAAFGFYAVLAYLLWRHVPSFAGRIVMLALGLAMVVCIGLSRIYLGVHYPSDVIGGWFASGVWLGIAIGLFQSYGPKPMQTYS